MARARAAAQVLDDLAGLKRGSLNLAASQTVANYWLPPRVETFRKAYPGIDLHVTMANTQQVAQAVNRGEADLGFVEAKLMIPRWLFGKWKATRWPSWLERAIRGSARRVSRQSF
jgi:DNA-binding transcriptional LysR family regulator